MRGYLQSGLLADNGYYGKSFNLRGSGAEDSPEKEVIKMAFIIPSALGLAVKIAGKLLPKKPKEVVKNLIADVVQRSPDIQVELEAERKFTLDYFGRAEHLPKAVQIIRSLVRPYCTVLFTTTLVVWLCIRGELPPEWFCWATAGMLGWWFGTRTAEWWQKRKIK